MRTRVLVLLSVLVSALVLPAVAEAGADDDPSVVGRWGTSFAEPTTGSRTTD